MKIRRATIEPMDGTICPYCKIEMVKDTLDYTCFHCGSEFERNT
jgi:DNA-directed RNA polymerase subunit RPC12/RpoP